MKNEENIDIEINEDLIKYEISKWYDILAKYPEKERVVIQDYRKDEEGNYVIKFGKPYEEYVKYLECKYIDAQLVSEISSIVVTMCQFA